MKRLLTLAFCLIGSLGIAPAAEEDSWIPLFDGKTTEGWAPRSEVITFEAKQGELHLHSKTNVWVTTEMKMQNFVVEAEVKLPEDAREVGFNSGLAFRCVGDTGKPKGYQIEIDGKAKGMSGGVYGIGLGGWLYPKTPEEKRAYAVVEKGLTRFDDWNQVKVVAEGPRIRTYFNGKLIADVKSAASLGGYFAIQHHGKGGTVKFRNIRAKKLPSPTPAAAAAATKDRPNILWITAEDMSPTLGCYGDDYATTPNIDKLAKESVVYDNAFAASPVCSPSRCCLITGMYPVSMGTHQMRSAYPLPTGVRGFPAYLREAGYYTTNNVKTDYNTGDIDRVIKESWDESSATAHWRGKKKGQPFFHVFNDMTSHQSRSMVWPYEAFAEHVQSKLSAPEVHDPKAAPVPAYYPDTQVIRKHLARYYDCVTAMDKNVGQILAELEEDGLADDTIVFFYSDHGSGMPRHKRLLLDSGMKVALMVRFPEKYKHLAPANAGERINDLVAFVDYPPTVLGMLGLDVPEYMQGIPFLGPNKTEPRKYVYGARDRVDEAHDMARSVRNGKYLYIRNYMPHLSYNQPTTFSDLGEIRDEITAIAAEKFDSLTGPQKAYAGPTKPVEEFYDCEADPQNLTNLIGSKLNGEAKTALADLRNQFKKLRASLADTGSLPESVASSYIADEGAPLRNIILGETNHKPDLDLAWKAADTVGKASTKEQLAALSSPNTTERFWAVIGLRNSAFADAKIHNQVLDYMDDTAPSVRIETASWLAAASEKHREAALKSLVNDLDHEDWWTAVRACRAIELLGEKARPVLPVMKALYAKTRHGKGDNNLFVAFSSGSFLEKMGEETEPWDFTPGAGSFSADPADKKKAR